MGSNAATNKAQQQKTIDLTSNLVNTKAFQPSPLAGPLNSFSQNLTGNYNNAVNQNTADYGAMNSGYSNLSNSLATKPPTTFNWGNVSYNTPQELTDAYGNLKSAASGYQDFANTGGYSAQDIADLRARGVSPIRATYSNAMMNVDRAKSLGGAGGSPNYIAATEKMQRELPGQLADATTNVNAGLADAIRQGKLSGLSGLAGVGGTQGGLASHEADQQLQAALANSTGNLNAAGMTNEAYNSNIGQQLAALGGRNQLYGTTPGMSSMFGNQALQGMGLQQQDLNNTNQFGLNLIAQNLQALNPNLNYNQNPWWKTALKYAGAIAPYVAAPFTGGASLALAPMTAGLLGNSSQAPSLGGE